MLVGLHSHLKAQMGKGSVYKLPQVVGEFFICSCVSEVPTFLVAVS